MLNSLHTAKKENLVLKAKKNYIQDILLITSTGNSVYTRITEWISHVLGESDGLCSVSLKCVHFMLIVSVQNELSCFHAIYEHSFIS